MRAIDSIVIRSNDTVTKEYCLSIYFIGYLLINNIQVEVFEDWRTEKLITVEQ